jgi:hypothetical protein
MNMTDLKVDIFFSQRTGRVVDNVFEAFQALVELLLLLVYYSEAEVDFIGLFKVRRHAHDLRESLFGVVERSITIIQDTNAVPQFGFLDRALAMLTDLTKNIATNLGISQVIKRLLVRSVGFLQVVHHKVTVT